MLCEEHFCANMEHQSQPPCHGHLPPVWDSPSHGSASWGMSCDLQQEYPWGAAWLTHALPQSRPAPDCPLHAAALLTSLFYLKLEASVSQIILLSVGHKEYPLPNQTSCLFHHQPHVSVTGYTALKAQTENWALFDPAHGQEAVGDVSYYWLVQWQWNQLKLLQGLKQV